MARLGVDGVRFLVWLVDVGVQSLPYHVVGDGLGDPGKDAVEGEVGWWDPWSSTRSWLYDSG